MSSPDKTEPTVAPKESVDPSAAPTILAGGPSSADVPVARRIGAYALLRLLGRGAMGQVWLAREEPLGRLVALKVMLAAGDGDARERFEREARACAALAHPNVVSLLGYGVHEGAPYCAMEYVEGGTLLDLLRREQVNEKRGAALLLQAAQGLAHAHERGIVHRDVKPANMLVAEGDRLRVADFGLARLAGHATLTASLGGMGTPAYMAPEQFESAKDATAASDVWSLGATMYEVLTGRPPFHAESVEALRRRVAVEDPLPVRSLSPAVSRDLETVCLKCLEKDPARRYPDAGALAADLARWQRGEPVQARPVGALGRFVRRVRRNPVQYAAAVLIGVALASGVALAQWAAAWKGYREYEALTRDAGAKELLAHLPSDPTEAVRALVTCEQRLREAQERSGEVPPFRYEVNRRLGLEAIRGWDYQLARLAFSVCQSLNRARAGKEGLDEDRVKKAERHDLAKLKKRVLTILDDIKQGLGRADREAGAPDLDDYVFEVSGYRDEQTVSLLAEGLEPFEKEARERGRDAHWTAQQAQVMTFCFRVLGRLDLPSAVEPLARMMAVLWDHTLCVECGRALCNTRCAEAEAPLLRAKDRLGWTSAAWLLICSSFARIPGDGQTQKPSTARGFAELAMHLRHKHDLGGAIQAATRALDLDPNCGEAWRERGLDHSATEEWESAIQDLTRAIELVPRDGFVWTLRGMARRHKGDLEGAIQDFTHAIGLDPKEWNAFRERGIALAQGKDLEGALRDCARAIDLDGLQPDSWFTRGNVRWLRGEFEEAVKDYDRAIELDPRCIQAYNGRGSVRRSKHDLAGALQDFARALEIDPKLVPAIFNQGLTRQEAGDWAGAIEDWRTFLDVAPGDPHAGQVRGWLADANVKVAEQQCGAADARGRDEAFGHLREAVKFGCDDPKALEGDAALAPLHDDPRWAELLRRVRARGEAK